ncbi:MAG: hypothetical protein IT383_00435 [Deltaproteobacteria bacterium]|nr:hypothetical protein [Deltaproteobacteria bacterium]
MRAPLLVLPLLASVLPALLAGPAAATEPPAAPAKTKVLVLDVKSTDLQPSEVATLTSLITSKLARYQEIEAISGQDLRRLVDLEAQKQAIGCDDAGCLAEMAGALGAQIVIFGQAGRLGGVLVVTLDAFDAQKGVAVARQPIEASDLGQLPNLVGPAVDRLVTAAFKERGGAGGVAGETLKDGGPILSGRAREVFEQAAMDLCVDGGEKLDWWFCDKGQRYTENAFVRRYRDLTGARDLDQFEVNRNKAGVLWPSLTVAGGAVLVLASLPVMYFGAIDKGTVPVLAQDYQGAPIGVSVGGLGALVGLGLSAWGGWMFLDAMKFTDGKPTDHTMKEAAAREATERHNAALATKTASDFAGAPAQ